MIRTRYALAAATCALGVAAASAQTFRSGVQGVSVNVSVRNGHAPVGGLTAADFELTDNGVPQTLTAVSLESAPIDITLLLDTSGSMAGPALAALEKDVTTIGGRLRPDDRLRVVTFASRVTEVLPMEQWSEASRRFSLHASGTTAFFHGLVAALLQPSTPGRPHVVVAISDTADNLSLLDGADVQSLAQRSDAVLHVIQRRYQVSIRGSYQVMRWGWLPYAPFSAVGDVREAAQSTGGQFVAETVDRPLPEIFKQTLDDFRTGYVLWFTPSGVATPGWHELGVRVKGRGHDVRARRGYFGG